MPTETKAETSTSPSGKTLEARIIRHLSFPYMVEQPNPLDPEEKTYVLEQLVADRGEKVFLRKVDIMRGERLGSFADGSEKADRQVVDSGLVEDVLVEEMDDAELEAWIREDKPNVPDTVAAAGTSPELAARLIDAETRATDGDPRKGVVDGLGEVIKRAGL